jgi:nicotinate phosphoribosyltransferase
MSTALLTDQYELTMVDAALRDGRALRRSVFELFARRLPTGRRFGVVAGTGRLLELVRDFRFGPPELSWLKREKVVSSDTLDWLEAFRFSGRIRGYREGELYFPGSPLLVVEGTFAEAVVLETIALSVLNYDSAVASAAARMVSAAGGRPLAEMGSRRTGERSAIAAARAAYIAGFAWTSNLEAGRTWGLPTGGTAAHSFTLLHDTEEEAFAAQVAAMGAGTTLLVDTYDITEGVATAVRVAGTGLGAVRIDSGDLGVVAREVRAQLDGLGATKTRITVTNDLDEFAIASLRSAPVDSYGVGTSLVTGSGAPAAGMVYKLVAHLDEAGAWLPVGKTSEGKATVGGRKQPVRALRSGMAIGEDIYVEDPPVAADAGRMLLTDLMVDGEPVESHLGPDGVTAARAHHASAIAELPPEAFSLSRGEPILPTRYL